VFCYDIIRAWPCITEGSLVPCQLISSSGVCHFLHMIPGSCNGGGRLNHGSPLHDFEPVLAVALVENDYTAQAPHELTLKKGDVLTDIAAKSKGWWLGTSKLGKRGFFPDSVVKFIVDPDKHEGSYARWCKVMFQYKPENEDELELQVGDTIQILSEVEEGWWKGKLNGKVGVFPSNFVKEIPSDLYDLSQLMEGANEKQQDMIGKSKKANNTEKGDSENQSKENNVDKPSSNTDSPDVPTLPPKPTKETCRVMFTYKAVNEDELNLNVGDVITIISKEIQDVGWWKGELNGKVGVFPDNFVELIVNEPAPKPDRPSKLSGSSSSLSSSKKKESISKSSSTTVMNSSSSVTSSSSSISRKFSDSLKSEDKVSPPSVSKKPVLPPFPMKKPQRSPSDLSKSPTMPAMSSKLPDSPTQVSAGSQAKVVSSSSIKQSGSNVNDTGSSFWNVTEGSDHMDGIGWSKQSSYSVIKYESSSVSVNSGNINSELDLDMVGRAAMLTHPTASRAKAPRRRPPSSVLKEGFDVTKAEEEGASDDSGLVNGDAETHTDKSPNKAPWVAEFMHNQMKKNQLTKTRVMIGPTASGDGPVSPEVAPNKPSTVGGVMLRQQQPSTGSWQRPQSMIYPIKTTSSSTSPSAPNASSSNTITDPVLLSHKQYKELNERVANLEADLKEQVETMSKTMKELMVSLEAERAERTKMQQEIDSLRKLLTQV